MKQFFSKYGYTIVKLFLNQFAIALFGMSLALATGVSENTTLQWVTSIFSVLFYLFLEYAVMWEVGAKDGISARAHKTKRGLWRGLVVALLANAINILLAILILPRAFAPEGTALFGMSSVFAVIANILEGMYMGIMGLEVLGVRLNTQEWMYFVIIMPALLVSSVAYILGQFDLHFTNILIQKNTDVKNNGRPE